jgi:hypothetical protein
VVSTVQTDTSAIDNGWRKDDPTLRIKKFAKGEFYTWTEEEIAQYESAGRSARRSGLRSRCSSPRVSGAPTW